MVPLNSELLETPPLAGPDKAHRKSTWESNREIMERLGETRLTFTASDGTCYPVTPWFSDEAEFWFLHGAQAAAEGPQRLKESKRHITEILKTDKPLQTALDKLGLSPDEAIKAVDTFTLQDCYMFDLHHRLLGKIDFAFGKGVHGRGYYDSPGFTLPGRPDEVALPVPELRVSQGEALDVISRYHAMLQALPEDFSHHNGAMGCVRNHVNFSFLIPNDGKYSGVLEDLRQQDPYVNLFELAKKDKAANMFVRKALSGIITAAEATDIVKYPDYYNLDRPYDLGTSRGETFRVARNRCEYRHGEGIRDHMADLMLGVVKGAEIGLKKTGEDEIPVILITACQVHFKNHKGDPDRCHFTRRVMEGARLKKEGQGYTLAINKKHFYSYSTKIEKELFGFEDENALTNLFGGAGMTHFGYEALRDVFANITLTERGADIAKAVDYMQQNPVFEKEHIERFKEIMSHIEGITFYPSFASMKAEDEPAVAEWHVRLRKLIHDPVIKELYGEKGRQPIVAETTAKIVSRVLAMTAVDNEQDEKALKQNGRAISEQLRAIVKAAPVKERIMVLKALQEGMQRATQSLCGLALSESIFPLLQDFSPESEKGKQLIKELQPLSEERRLSVWKKFLSAHGLPISEKMTSGLMIEDCFLPPVQRSLNQMALEMGVDKAR